MAKMRRDTADRWYDPLYDIGYIENRGGIATIVIRGRRKSTKMRMVQANKMAAKSLLRQAIAQTLDISGPPMSVLDAIREFKDDQLKGASRDVLESVHYSFQHYLTEDHALANFDAIQRMILRNDVEIFRRLSPSSRRKDLVYLKKFFEYCRRRQWMTNDPTATIQLPKIEDKQKFILSMENVRVLSTWFINTSAENVHPHPVPQLLLHHNHLMWFLYLSACRINEALQVRPERDYTDAYLEIQGKGRRKRRLPMGTFPGLKSLIDYMLEHDVYATPGKLFKWETRTTFGFWFEKALIGTGIMVKDEDGNNHPDVTPHTLRASAEHYWEKVLRLPVEVITDLAGHSLAVYAKNYRKRMEESELESSMQRALDLTGARPVTEVLLSPPTVAAMPAISIARR